MQRLNIPYFACSLLLLVLGTAQTVSTDSGDKPSRVIHLIERVQAVSFQDPDPTGTSLGDRIIFTSNLFDEKGH